jgi:hypothetical protein
MRNVIAKLREPSTISGIAALLGVVGIAVPVEVVQYAGMIIIGAASIWDIYREEKSE